MTSEKSYFYFLKRKIAYCFLLFGTTLHAMNTNETPAFLSLDDDFQQEVTIPVCCSQCKTVQNHTFNQEEEYEDDLVLTSCTCSYKNLFHTNQITKYWLTKHKESSPLTENPETRFIKQLPYELSPQEALKIIFSYQTKPILIKRKLKHMKKNEDFVFGKNDCFFESVADYIKIKKPPVQLVEPALQFLEKEIDNKIDMIKDKYKSQKVKYNFLGKRIIAKNKHLEQTKDDGRETYKNMLININKKKYWLENEHANSACFCSFLLSTLSTGWLALRKVKNIKDAIINGTCTLAANVLLFKIIQNLIVKPFKGKSSIFIMQQKAYNRVLDETVNNVEKVKYKIKRLKNEQRDIRKELTEAYQDSEGAYVSNSDILSMPGIQYQLNKKLKKP